MIKSYQELIIWQKAMNLTKEVYSLCLDVPSQEKFGLISQMQRSAVAIPSNIAEGHQRGTKEFVHFLTIASGSLCELETQLILTQELYDINISALLIKCDELGKILGAMKKRLRQKSLAPSR